MIVFLIPVRHEDSVSDYNSTWTMLNYSLTSLAAQDNVQWHAVICANKVLPMWKELPHEKLTFIEHERDYVGKSLSQWDQAEFDQHLLDKTIKRRIAAEYASRTLKPSWYFMMDADDCVSNNLVSSIHMVSQRQYLFINLAQGLVVDTKTHTYRTATDFNRICGTSVAIRPSLVHHHFNETSNLISLLAQHRFEDYHKRFCQYYYQRYAIESRSLAAYVQHDDNYGRAIWNHRKFDKGEEITKEICEQFQIPGLTG